MYSLCRDCRFLDARDARFMSTLSLNGRRYWLVELRADEKYVSSELILAYREGPSLIVTRSVFLTPNLLRTSRSPNEISEGEDDLNPDVKCNMIFLCVNRDT